MYQTYCEREREIEGREGVKGIKDIDRETEGREAKRYWRKRGRRDGKGGNRRKGSDKKFKLGFAV